MTRSQGDRIFGNAWVGIMAVIAMMMLCCLSAEASAQTSPLAVPRQRPDQEAASQTVGRAPALPAARAAEPDWPRVPFKLRALRISGSSLRPKTLAAAYRPFLGRTIDKTTLLDLTGAIAAVYARSNVALYVVQVPDQDLGDRTLRLVVVEGYVEGLEIDGKVRARRRALLESYTRRLERDRPLRTTTLQRVASFIRAIPGLSPNLAFVVGSRPGAVKLLVGGTDAAAQAALKLGNRGIALLGRTQMQADLYADGIFRGGDQLHTTLLLPIRLDRFQSVTSSYSTPLDSDGTTLLANIGYLRTQPRLLATDGETFRLDGHSLAVGAQISHAVVSSDVHSLTATLGIDAIDSHNALLGYTLARDRIRAARAAIAFSGSSARSRTSLGITVSFGLDAFGARTTPGEAKPAFRKINLRFASARAIGTEFVLRVNACAQLTGARLPASEQLALGGDEYGRAYQADTIAGDRGYAASSELAWRPRSGPGGALNESELYVFGDGGSVRYRGRLDYPAIRAHLASAGAGLRAHWRDKNVVELEVARALDDPRVPGRGGGTNVVFSIKRLL